MCSISFAFTYPPSALLTHPREPAGLLIELGVKSNPSARHRRPYLSFFFSIMTAPCVRASKNWLPSSQCFMVIHCLVPLQMLKKYLFHQKCFCSVTQLAVSTSWLKNRVPSSEKSLLTSSSWERHCFSISHSSLHGHLLHHRC